MAVESEIRGIIAHSNLVNLYRLLITYHIMAKRAQLIAWSYLKLSQNFIILGGEIFASC